MEIYLDTSFVAALALKESHSKTAIHLFEASSKETLITSLWTKVEFASLLARRVRMKELTTLLAAEITTFFEKLALSFSWFTPKAEDFTMAVNLLHRPEMGGLRAGDAIHLAIARNLKVTHFYTLDRQFLKLASAVGFKTNL